MTAARAPVRQGRAAGVAAQACGAARASLAKRETGGPGNPDSRGKRIFRAQTLDAAAAEKTKAARPHRIHRPAFQATVAVAGFGQVKTTTEDRSGNGFRWDTNGEMACAMEGAFQAWVKVGRSAGGEATASGTQRFTFQR